jgi:hypothetical protein
VRRRTRLGLVALSLATFAALLGACGSTTTESPPAPKTYTNDQYGFSMTYDGRFEEGPTTGDASAASRNAFLIAFPDKNGPMVNDTYADGLQVNVYALPRKLKPAEVPLLKKQVTKDATSIVAAVPGGKLEQPVEKITVNGVPGFSFGYSYLESDTPIRAKVNFLFKGQYQYALTGKATADTWDAMQPQLESTLLSFTVK